MPRSIPSANDSPTSAGPPTTGAGPSGRPAGPKRVAPSPATRTDGADVADDRWGRPSRDPGSPAAPAPVPSVVDAPGPDGGHDPGPVPGPEHVVSDDTSGDGPDGPVPVRHLLPSGHSTTRTGAAAAVTGLLWAAAAAHFGEHLLVTPFLVFLALAVAVSVTDLSHRLVPRTLLYGGPRPSSCPCW